MPQPQSSVPEVPPRRFGLLPILDFYVFKEFMIPFSALMLAFCILFLIGDIFSDLGEFLEYKQPISGMIHYFSLKMPGNIRFILPISVLLACMYTMANFGRYREVTAMRASGISLLRCGGSIYFAAFIVTLVNFWFNEQLVPYTEREAFLAYRRIQYPDIEEELYSMLQYRSKDKLRDWLFKNFDSKGVQKNIILKKYRQGPDSRKYLEWDIRAEEASFIPDVGWEFRKVTRTPYSQTLFIPGSSEKLPSVRIPLSEMSETPQEIMNAVKPPEDLPSWTIYGILRDNGNMAPTLRNIYSTILYYRLAFPWSCFLGVFLGLPLAARNERAGVFLSIVTAVIAIVVFQILTQVFMVLGKQGVVPPLIAGLAPTAAFMIYGWFFVIRRSG